MNQVEATVIGAGTIRPRCVVGEQRDHRVDERRSERFNGATMQYRPDLADGELQPAYAGICPGIRRPREVGTAIEMHGCAVHGVPGLVNLFGIELPGLTSSLAIGDVVAAPVSGGSRFCLATNIGAPA